jgi:exoribonuclease R
MIASPRSAPRPVTLPLITDFKRNKLSTGTFNIDPSGCKDIDDVITLEKVDDKIWKISVTIADVSEMVNLKSPQWTAAAAAGATVYQDGAVVRPMFHRHLSEEICSLLPGKIRYGVALMAFWEGGHLSAPFFQKVLVTNQESYTYDTIYKSKTVPLDILKGICSEIAGRIVFDSHEWVETLMLWYNRNAATILRNLSAGLLRKHDKPFEERLAQVNAVSSDLQFLAYRSAEYCGADKPAKHHGLGVDVYCHASSPIRRFADLLNQVIIKRWIDGDRVAAHEDFEGVAAQLNQRQKEIAAHDRHYALLRAIHGAVRIEISGKVLWTEGAKAVVWIDEWKTIVRIKSDAAPGETMKLRYFCDRRKAQWKERIIYEVIKTPESTSSGAHI